MTATGKLIRRELRERAEEEARTEDSKLSGNRGNRNLA